VAETEKKYQRYVFAVSDATGRTCETVVQAALRQFTATDVILERAPQVATQQQVQEIFQRAAKVNGVIVYTMVSPELRQLANELSRLYAVPVVDILGPVLTRLADLLEMSPMAQPGLMHQLSDDYYHRITALNFALKHDDGCGADSLREAEIVLVGLSRTCKTPISIYLSYAAGWWPTCRSFPAAPCRRRSKRSINDASSA